MLSRLFNRAFCLFGRHVEARDSMDYFWCRHCDKFLGGV